PARRGRCGRRRTLPSFRLAARAHLCDGAAARARGVGLGSTLRRGGRTRADRVPAAGMAGATRRRPAVGAAGGGGRARGMLIIAQMSGTPLDGVAAALVRIEGDEVETLRWTVESWCTVEYSDEQRRALHEGSVAGSAASLCALDADLGEWLAAAAAW